MAAVSTRKTVQRRLAEIGSKWISTTEDMLSDNTHNDFVKVEYLFISRFCIEKADDDGVLFALKSNPDEFLYSVFVDTFIEERNMYEIRLSRYTDTAQNYFYFDPDTDKFYTDGNKPKEITEDDSIFLWSF